MVVQHNLTAMNANRYLGINNNKLSKSLEKLSSGFAINRAGDNAAGLAVSEKMRSQIAGMTQAVKNAQDGISMVQTFEGALTETDSILQRMKTLADQMANGTYDDPVDRTAAQQEFLQLNDELDQIADTDFNGVTVLNGGVMSDGTCAEGITAEFGADGHVTSKDASAFKGSGVIDYKAAKEAREAAAAAGGATPTNKDYGDGKIADNNDYNKTKADEVWKALGIDAADVEKVEVTFQYDGSAWKAVAAVDATSTTKTAIKDAKLDKLTATKVAGDGTTDGEGGVKITADTTDITKVVFASTDAVKGDTLTISFQNKDVKNYAPEHYSWAEDAVKNATAGNKTGDFVNAEKFDKMPEIALSTAVTGEWDDSGEAYKAILDELSKSEFTFDYGTNATAPTAISALTTTAADKKVKGADGGEIGTLSITGNKVQFTYKDAAAAAKYGGAKGAAHGTNAFDIITFTPKALDAAPTASSKISFKGINFADYQAGSAKDLQLHSVETSQVAKDAAKGEGYAVSKSDAFKNSEAKMTYTNNITLQVGARTKDAVNFTFTYASTSIGNLNPDLDCTAYGLGTNKLNLNDQKSANEAVDKIDQAINKVSLVRGTFGAIQNRLEHKIDNLNVSVENLTSAESQIRDTNMPQEMMNFTKQQILAQASQSMLAQANQLPQGVLSLLQ